MKSCFKISAVVMLILFSVLMTSYSATKKVKMPDTSQKTVGGVSFVYIPAGSFIMGRDVKGTDYTPSRNVKITQGFWISIYEITQKKYSEIKNENPCKKSRYGEGDALPVFNVSWYDAVEFCNLLSVKNGLKPYYLIYKDEKEVSNISPYDVLRWKIETDEKANGFRLPTEAQWEYACMGTKRSNFYWGNNQTWDGSGKYAWHMFNAGHKNYSKGRFWWVKYHKVKKPGEKKPNSFGIYDMSGNVGEWCYDRYAPSSYSSALREDPYGGDGEFRYRVVRGGSILDAPKDLVSYKRWPVEPFEKTGTNGIRVVLPE